MTYKNFQLSSVFSTFLILLILSTSFTQLLFIKKSEAGNVAIDGYDTVAYFTLKKAIKGTDQNTYQWKGKTWHFSSSKHKELFIANPEKYAPQFNGLCANGLSDGHAIDANPRNWRIIEGKLYLFFSEYGRDQWAGDVKPLIQNAEETLRNQ